MGGLELSVCARWRSRDLVCVSSRGSDAHPGDGVTAAVLDSESPGTTESHVSIVAAPGVTNISEVFCRGTAVVNAYVSDCRRHECG